MGQHLGLRIALLMGLLLGLACGQDTLRSVAFEGLARTQPGFLLRFVGSEVGQPVDTLQALADAQRLQNLSFLSQVQVRWDSGAALCFVVKEAWTRFPLLAFGGVRGNTWAQVGFTDGHLMGRGWQLSTFYQLSDGRHGGQVYLRLPYLGHSRWGATLSLLRWASTEPLYFGDQAVYYDYDNYSLGATALYEPSPGSTWEVGATFFLESYRKDQRHAGLTTPGPEQAQVPKLLLKAAHRGGIVNQYGHQFEGWDLTQQAQAIYDLPYQSWFHIYWADLRWFRRLGGQQRLNLAMRLRAGLSTNLQTPFAPFVLDSHVNIRGSGNRIDRGTGVLTWNLELRQTLWEPWRTALQGVLFSDLGAWRQPGGTLADFVQADNLHQFVGLGLRLVLKPAHHAVLRADYGLNPYAPEQRGLVLGLGQYF